MADRVFVVRFWSEQQHDSTSWRGRIENLATGERRYFDDLETLMAIIARAIGGQAARPGGPRRVRDRQPREDDDND